MDFVISTYWFYGGELLKNYNINSFSDIKIYFTYDCEWVIWSNGQWMKIRIGHNAYDILLLICLDRLYIKYKFLEEFIYV